MGWKRKLCYAWTQIRNIHLFVLLLFMFVFFVLFQTTQQPIPGFIQGMKNELLSVMGSTNNFSFNDFVSRIFSNINGILPPPIITNSLLHPQFIGSTIKSEAFLPVTPMISSPNVLNLNPTTTIANGNLNNPQMASAFHSTFKEMGTSNGDFEFPIPTNPNIFEMDKSASFKSINGIFSTPKLTGNDIKFKDNNNSLINTHQEHWKRFKCSACGHRSNWKWDINKHIKVKSLFAFPIEHKHRFPIKCY